MGADQHLLFGLLALQTGLIDHTALIAAFHAWTRNKAKSLADHLIALGHIDGARRAAVEALAALHVEARGGDVEKSLAAVPAARSTRQSLALLADADIAASISHVGTVPRYANEDADRTDSYSVGTASSDGGRFRVLRPHARGGLGAVFVALDTELQREVALKQMLDHHADDPVSRGRFVIEAEITGGLEHPGIVPVYGLGTFADGRPFYAMRFVRGDSLKDAIDRYHGRDAPSVERSEAQRHCTRPWWSSKARSTQRADGRRSLELHKLLRRFTDVCNAIGYAHSRGVLHRDVKPGNVVVGKHGETLVVDWGLAKATGRSEPGAGERTLLPSSASGSAETLPGSALGTPAYMSPEQAAGDLERLGPRSDVYSLGATLYSILTGRPPQRGDDAADLLRRVQRGEFTRPRQIDPSIDPALEAVCLKAMALNPQDRYTTPRQLADEIDRWMADEPVTAYREPLSRRVRRWSKRNRTAMTAGVVALLAGVVGLAAVTVVQAQANAKLALSKAAVQARYDLAVDAIKTFHTGVSEDFLLKEEKFKALRDRLLKSAAEFYGKLSALLGKEREFASRRALTASKFELAELIRMVGKHEDSLAAHRAVAAERAALATEPGAGTNARVDVGRSLLAVARLLEATGRTADAMSEYRKSEALLARLAFNDAQARAALASCRSRMAYLLSSTGENDPALATYRLAFSAQEALSDAPGAPNDARRDLADTIHRIGILLSRTGKPAEAEAEYRKALEIQQKLADENPAVTEFRNNLADSHKSLGVLLSNTGRPAEAEAEYRKALEIQHELADENPAVTEFRSSLADSRNNLGALLSNTGKPAEAEAEYRQALVIRQKLADENLAVTQFQSRLANSHYNLGLLLWTTGKPAEAEAEYHQALVIRQKLADENPAVTDFRSRLADTHNNLGILLRAMGRPAGAEAEYRQALAIRQKLADENPAITDFHSRLADSHNALGWMLSQTDRPVQAEAAYRMALALDRKLADDNPSFPYYRGAVANLDNNLALVLRRLGRPAEARDHGEQAVAARERLVKNDPNTTAYRAGLAESYLNRGLARRALGDLAGAAADLRRALGLFNALQSRSGEDWFLFGCSHAALSDLSVRVDSGVPNHEASTEAEAAMTLLHRAVDLGYRNPAAYRTEDALDALRERRDFQLMMMDLAMPATPFAAAR
jgi:eukaryotic-like serine/threonine-protein kinase